MIPIIIGIALASLLAHVVLYFLCMVRIREATDPMKGHISALVSEANSCTGTRIVSGERILDLERRTQTLLARVILLESGNYRRRYPSAPERLPELPNANPELSRFERLRDQ